MAKIFCGCQKVLADTDYFSCYLFCITQIRRCLLSFSYHIRLTVSGMWNHKGTSICAERTVCRSLLYQSVSVSVAFVSSIYNSGSICTWKTIKIWSVVGGNNRSGNGNSVCLWNVYVLSDTPTFCLHGRQCDGRHHSGIYAYGKRFSIAGVDEIEIRKLMCIENEKVLL